MIHLTSRHLRSVLQRAKALSALALLTSVIAACNGSASPVSTGTTSPTAVNEVAAIQVVTSTDTLPTWTATVTTPTVAAPTQTATIVVTASAEPTETSTAVPPTSTEVPPTATTVPPTATSAPTETPAIVGRYQDGTYIGDGVQADRWGTMQVQAIIAGGALVNVEIIDYPHSTNRSNLISRSALPILVSEAITNQEANVDLVSRATDTSVAFIASLDSALADAVVGGTQ